MDPSVMGGLAVPDKQVDADINPKPVAMMTEGRARGQVRRMDTKGMLIEDAGIATKTQRVVMRPVCTPGWKKGEMQARVTMGAGGEHYTPRPTSKPRLGLLKAVLGREINNILGVFSKEGR